MKYLMFSLIITIHGVGMAQNLVSNGSFEVSACNPNQFDTFAPYHGWDWYSPSTGTPDYFMDGSENGGCAIQDINSAGFQMFNEWQYPQDGLRMAGIYSFIDIACVREYLQTKLLTPLQANRKYCVSFYVSLSNRSLLAIDRLGIALTNDSVVDYSPNCPLTLQPQLLSPAGTMLTDTAGWTLVSGEYTAVGGERFLTLGNLLPQEEVNFIEVDGTGNINAAYYYIDNVVVEDCSLPNGLVEFEVPVIRLWPNPSRDKFFVNCPLSGSMELCDLAGNILLKKNLLSGNNSFSTLYLPSGVYAVRVFLSDGSTFTEKLVVE